MYATSPQEALSRSAHRRLLSGGAVTLLFLIALPGAIAQDAGRDARFAVGIEGEFRARSEKAAERRLADAARAARAMSATPAIADLLTRARGVYIVPAYGRAALGVGAAGGSGVLMARRADGQWGNPAFFTMGGLGIGLQAGAEGGPVALLLMNQKAVDRFRKRNNFSLGADAGLTVLNYRRMAAGSTAGDVVAWSGGKGVFGNAATVSINDIRYNRDLTHAHYGKPVSARQAIDGAPSDRRAHALRTALGERRQPARAHDN
ncbi:lipid-binding SYLF domain-containing protein [Massilia sp. SYSU DXS3249]